MRFEYLIGLRHLRARRRERFVSVIALISLAGVALGTFALTAALSVMSGFQEDLRNRLLAFTPQITIERSDGRPWNPDELKRRIGALPGVVASAPFISSQVMVVAHSSSEHPAYVSGGMMRGVIAENNPVLTELRRTLRRGSLAALDHPHRVRVVENGQPREVELPGAIVGRALAFDLGLRVGDPLVLISPASLGAGVGGPRLRRFVVVGFFYSGMYEFDASLIFVALKDARTLLGNAPHLDGGLELRVADLFEAPAIGRKIAAIAGPQFKVSNWTMENAPLFSALQLEKFTYFLVLLLIVLVAAFNIIATLVMVVMERRKEIAILRAMGARAGSIAAIFLCEGAVLGAVGTMLGVGSGFVFSYLVGRYHLIRLPASLFMVSYVPVRLYAGNFVVVALAAIALCLGAALYPALKARALSPVEVIRYE